MATWYVDPINGNDSNAGTSFAARWKTFAGSGSGSIAGGDTIRVIQSPAYTNTGVNATWTQQSVTVTLSAAVTQNITSCDFIWTAVTNTTTALDSVDSKEGASSIVITVQTAFTTGKAAYYAPAAPVNLSSYQQISFWIKNDTAIAASALQIKLCSDTLGATAVNTFTLPAIPSTGQWVPMTLNNGSALGSSIASIALYCASDLSASANVVIKLDNIFAVKSPSSVDSLSLTSLISKKWSQNWAASTAYSANDYVKPTTPNRTGYIYKAGGSGTSGGSEPTWPTSIGATVSDNGIAWTCSALEETWYPIMSISGTTVTLAGPRTYSGATETVALLKREPLSMAMVTATTTSTLITSTNYTFGSSLTFSGGWDSTAMSTQSGETWLDGQNGLGNGLYIDGNHINVNNFGFTRFYKGILSDGGDANYYYCHSTGNGDVGMDLGNGFTSTGPNIVQGCNFSHNNDKGVYGTSYQNNKFIACTFNGNGSDGIYANTNTCTMYDIWAVNNATNGMTTGANQVSWNVNGSLNGSVDVNTSTSAYFYNSSFTAYQVTASYMNQYVFSHNHNNTNGYYEFKSDGGMIISDSTTRHTASGIAWKFYTTGFADGRRNSSSYPLQLSVAKLVCTANTTYNISIWCYKDNASMNGRLFVPGKQLTGVWSDTYVTCTPASLTTWTQSSNLTITPTMNGVIEIFFQVWDTSAPSSGNFWIDDLTIV